MAPPRIPKNTNKAAENKEGENPNLSTEDEDRILETVVDGVTNGPDVAGPSSALL